VKKELAKERLKVQNRGVQQEICLWKKSKKYIFYF